MRTYIIAVAALLAASAAFAGETKGTAAPAAEKGAQAVEITSATVVSKLAEWDKKLETLQMSFTQTVKFADAGVSNEITGKVYFKKPNLLRVDHISPQKQIVYTDKQTIWIYKPQDKQAIKLNWADWLSQQSGMLSGITDFGAYASLATSHNVKVSAPDKSPLVEVTLTPKGKKSYELTMLLSREDFFPVSFTLKMDSTVVETRLSSVVKNGPLDQAMLEFKAPQGTDVLEAGK